MDLLLGIDVGTTRVKTLAFDLQGHVVGQAAENCGLSRPQPGWVEQDPEELWQALVATVRGALASLPCADCRVLGLALSTQGGTTIVADSAGRPLRPAISWMDQRGTAESQDLAQVLGRDEVYRFSGWAPYPGLPWVHAAWLQRHEPDRYLSAARLLTVSDWLLGRLTGEFRQDPTNAGITQLYHVVRGDWHETALGLVGLRREQLAPLAPCGERVGRLTPAAAEALHLTTDTWVMNGAHDQYAAAVGAGVTAPGRVLLSCGTAWVLLVATGEPAFGEGEQALGVGRHALPGLWGAMRSMGGVGTTVEWYVDTVLAPLGGWPPGERAKAFAAMDAHLPGIAPGAGDLCCIPLAGGHSQQQVAAVGLGGFVGLHGGHGQFEMGRAILEGIAFELRWLIETIRSERMPIESLVMVGGASQSACWPQIIAGVTGLAVTVPAVQEAAARGAAILAGAGLGLLDLATGFATSQNHDRQLEPRGAERRAYETIYKRYRAVQQALERVLLHEAEP
ncbi:MAG: xylulokinase [Anaerolineae bacterium]